jgi:hypothetical protein
LEEKLFISVPEFLFFVLFLLSFLQFVILSARLLALSWSFLCEQQKILRFQQQIRGASTVVQSVAAEGGKKAAPDC